MSLVDDLFVTETLTAVRDKVLGFAAGAGLTITDWIVGDPGQQLLETVTQALQSFTQITTGITRGFVSLDTSTDPGDPDPWDPENENLTPAQGYLTAFGLNTFFTTRQEASFATGAVTFTNAGAIARTFLPGGLVFTWSVSPPTGNPPTYRNAADPAIYTNPDGSVTVAAGAHIDLPIVAEEIGSRSSAPPSRITLTTSLVGCSATNAAAVTGTDREDAEVYRGKCRQAPARVSLGGPVAIYEYLATKNLDGTPLLNASNNTVGITKVSASNDSATGIVDVYYAANAAAPLAEDVTAANNNIEAEAFACPDSITFTGAAATVTTVTVAGTGKLTPGPGRTTTAAKQAIVDALAAYAIPFPIGGKDQVAGAGVVYKVDLQAVAAAAYPGLYDVLVTTPAGATSAIAAGHVMAISTSTVSWTIT